ncbi:hypothetical protein [Cellulomonas marina]|uniref:hypothetical protein n=1 Tax=Cellulomonas marina TaxID=988821 RepID=UPI00111394E0|nr:hypothetical protein [Cellulomonas marina]
MPLAVVALPDTALLVPGVAGRSDPLADLRTAAVAAVRRGAAALGERPGTPADDGVVARATDLRVAVVAPGPADRALVGRLRGSFAAAGVPDAALGAVVPVVDVPEVDVRDATPVPGVAAARPAIGAPGTGVAVALHVLVAAGLDAAPVSAVLEVAGAGAAGAGGAGPDGRTAGRAAVLRRWGAALVAEPGPLLLLVVGSGSARHGPDGPLADDPRAPAVDEALVAALGDPGAWAAPDGPPPAGLDEATAAALAVSAWAPWQVLAGALAARTAAGHVGTPPAVDASLGVLHAVGLLLPAAADGA